MKTTGHTLPFITFSIVTFNEEHRIRRCLDGITSQQYPKDRIEILVMDGGSTDRTKEIAESYGATVYFNKDKLPEPGLAAAYEKAKGDYMVYMAADNVLFDPEWTMKMIQPVIDNPKDVVAVFSKVRNDPHDSIWNKYINEDQDPFSAFTFGNASHPDKFGRLYPLDYKGDGYVVYKYDHVDFPLIALAQCTMLKTGLKRKKESRFDDIMPLVDLIKEGKKIAYVTNTGLYHYSFSGFSNYVMKFRNRIYNSIRTNSYDTRDVYNPAWRKIRKYLFIPYSLTVVGPTIEGIYLAVRKRKWYMIIHPLASFVIGFLIIFNFCKIKLWKR